MKHFKYKFGNAVNNRLAGQRFGRVYYIRKVVFALSAIVLFAVVIGLILLCKYVSYIEGVVGVWKTVLLIVTVAGSIVLPIALCALLAVLVNKFLPIYGKYKVDRLVVYKCAEPLRKYYHIGTDYIVTKCYRCSVKALSGKDVTVFIYNGKLRITNDFTSTVKDFGCYEIDKSELEYDYTTEADKTATRVKCPDFEIVLGKRAKPFLRRNMI